MRLGLDTEVSGVDHWHGARAFLLTLCTEEGESLYWEWDVNPLTRVPLVPREDAQEIKEWIEGADEIIIQNAKYDFHVLFNLFKDADVRMDWKRFWRKVRCTLIGAHLKNSGQPHDLTTLALIELRKNIKPYEDAKAEAVRKARALCRSKPFIERHGEWRIAKAGLPDMPSAGDSSGAFDMWLPRAVAKAEGYEEGHPNYGWHTVVSDYCNIDGAVLLPLYEIQKRYFEQNDLWEIYVERMKLLPIVCEMENNGVSLSKTRLEELMVKYAAESEELGKLCVNIAYTFDEYELKLPKAGNNDSLRGFVFGGLVKEECASCGGTGREAGHQYEKKFRRRLPACPVCEGEKTIKKTVKGMQLPVVARTKEGNASLDSKVAIPLYQARLPERSRELKFINSLADKRKRDTALSYMESYKTFWLPTMAEGFYRLHPSFNPTGTATLRFSSSNPNAQNISKKDDFNLRYAFGPAPGRMWISLDYSNLELVIPAYYANEQEMINLFEHPDDPPYFGSQHLLVSHILWKKEFEECLKDGVSFKDRYKSTKYQWTKNGSFAVQYGAIPESGTADRAYHQEGAQIKVQERFSNIKKLNQQMIAMANRCGYVETIPDRSIGAKRGYPIYCGRTEYGKVSPTVPLNYFVQGTAMWCISRAMVRVQEFISTLIPKHFITMQIHDELVIDAPAGSKVGPEIKKLMEMSGDDIGIPLKASISYHPENWSEAA